MSKKIKHMDIAEFRKLGFLQEVNRQFFHPLGLAMEVIIEDDGSERIGGIWDYRNDPEGMVYSDTPSRIKADSVEAERQRHVDARTKLMGHPIQATDGFGL